MVSHTLINFTDKEVAWAIDMGQQRHGAKHNSFREKSRMGSISKVFGGSHILGVLGELAYEKYTGIEMDRNIYSVRDRGYDFKTSKNSDKNFKIDIKTITYNGEGEKELKIKVSEYAKNIPDEYVLIYIDKDNLKEATILGCISRSNFEKNKKEKQYRRDYPSNYYVGESSLRAIKNY
tara:strand:- start:151 stop:684 length:534 start_codon:yes stop_codon:yes gene_type:complete